MHPLDALPLDNTFARLPDVFYSRVAPEQVPDPYLVHYNTALSEELGIDPDAVHTGDAVQYLCGNAIPPGADPVAQLYSGHQFGQYNPQLGDGRALLLGEVVNGHSAPWDLQLKGSGRTPYSRMGDGRAVLRSTIREYLCSAAMTGLGIPTTRALSIVGSDMAVYREEIETAAILMRVAETHVRFGTFEIFYWSDEHDRIRELADYVIAHHFAHLVDDADKYAQFLTEVVERTARLIAYWQAAGFTHGVMNTDNMSILGLTLDYGPFGFLDAYNPSFIPNHSDPLGRYAFDKQPSIGLWNCERLAEALLPVIDRADAEAALAAYAPAFNDTCGELMRHKLGLATMEEADTELLMDLFGIMTFNKVDYTIFFRRLCDFSTTDEKTNEPLRAMFDDTRAFDEWARAYAARLKKEFSVDGKRREQMRRANPKFVLRNYLAQTAIEKATQEKDYSEIDTLMTVLTAPFDEWAQYESYADAPPEWARGIALSCSS